MATNRGLKISMHWGWGNSSFLPATALCLNAGAMGRQDAESETLIPTFGGVFDVSHTLKAEGFDASEDGTGRGTPLVPVAHVSTMPTTMNGANTPAGHNARSGHSKDSYIVPVAFGWQNSASQGASASEHITPTPDKSKTPAVAVALRGRDGGATAELGDEVGNALRASQGGGDKPHVLTGMAVRRLTPVECERLQGFPDGYTDIRERGKPTPDGPRYKALGNSMAVPCMRWIGERIAAVDAITAKAEAA